MGLEDPSLNDYTAVTEEVSLPLLIELTQQLRLVACHLHLHNTSSWGGGGERMGAREES